MIRPESSKYGPPPADCPVAECLRFLSATWTPEILWFLHAQSRRFGDLRRDLVGISAKVLTVRLRELERRGAVQRTVKATSPPTVEYSLTELGRRFVPVLEQIAVMGGVLTGRVVTPADFPPALGPAPAAVPVSPRAARGP
jgi:DNA-binding HxlR family transcriptional regulator